MMNNELRPYEKYKESKNPFILIIPEGWQECRFHNIVKLKSIRGNSNEDLLSVYLNQGVIKYSDTSQKQVHKPSEDMSNYQLVEPGDLVMNNQQAWRGSVGVSKHRGVVSPAYYVFELRKSINSTYANYIFRESAMVSQFVTSSKGVGTIQRNLFYPYLKNAIVVLPPHSEQDKIVKYLNHQLAKINKFIKTKKKLISVLKEQKQAIINEAVTKGINPNAEMKPSGIEWLGDVPEHWDIGKLKKYAKLNPSMNDLKSKYTSEDNVVFLSMDKISVDGDIDNSELRSIKDVRTGFTAFTRQDVVIAKITPCFENGKGAFLENLDTELGYGTTELIVIRPDQTRLLGKYLYYVTRCEYFRIFGSEVMTGSAGQKRVPSSFVVNFSIGFPGINEQKAIVSAIEKQHELMNNSIKILNKEVELMTEYKNSLISDVVTGKVDVRNVIIDETGAEVIEDTELDEESIDEKILEVEDGDE